MAVTLVRRVGTGKTDPFCEGKEEGCVLVKFKGVRICGDTKRRETQLALQ